MRDSRAAQIRRMFTAAGVPGLESKHSQVLGLRGWRIYVTNQGENSARLSPLG